MFVSVLYVSLLDNENYYKKEIIKCRNGSKKFSQAQLNDDFCDCSDGSDEPGTSACPHGKFYCRNVGHLPVSLHSSKVNDGICGKMGYGFVSLVSFYCCDGSDEYNGEVKCPNSCWEAGKVARDKLKKKIDIYKEGVAIRKKEVKQAKQAIAKDKEELSKLKNEEKSLKGLVKKLKAHKEQIERAEEKERLMKEKEEMMKTAAEDKSDDEQKESSNSKTLDSENNGPSPTVDQQQKDEYENTEGLSTDGSESTEALSREELGRLVASRWTGENTEHQAEDLSPTKDGDNNEIPESSHDKDHHNNDGVNILNGPSWLEKLQDAARNLFQAINLSPVPLDKLDANRVRKDYDDSSTRLSDIQDRIASLTEKLKHDFGMEKEFYLFYDQCFETKQDKYVYKVCPFKDASQEEGYSKTQLGQWEKFENSYGSMLFSNGDGCWNGPDRSLKVKLRCGLKTELTDVNEPSRCEYVALLSTPIRCLEQKLEELQRKLESMYQEQPQVGHDEL
ncbi:unnamed protein product [Dovyalis caffra]|uniref:Glucosidase 2 subunit beta n=1 Tax=Dovyalis caffra TaxID=77055 RepID=A0AAV1S0M8_9ROSI|nr:unnamed protein product [Dovyalis caffra]